MHILSKVDQESVLHIIIRKTDIQEQRTNVIEEQEFLQLATMRLSQGTTFKPHFHKWIKNTSVARIAQEAWVVISGNVEVTYYDLDNAVIHTDVLTPGDCSVTLFGGHNYRAMDEAIVYEFKTGPYEGQELDKEMI